MQRPGSDPENMCADDFLCDFCGSHWSALHPMVEGHRGSLICGECLSRAYAQVIVRNSGVVVPEHVACTMCLLNKRGDYWQSPVRAELAAAAPRGVEIQLEPGACICRWCIEKSAGMMEQDAASGWKKPG